MRNAMKPLFLLAALAATAPALAQRGASPAAGDLASWGMLETYCTECHNATDWAGGVAFDTLSPGDVPHEIKLWERTVRKLRGHLMPPPGNKQPTQAEKDAMVGWLETSLDSRRETPRAEHVTAQRLNRTEYANAVRSLLGIEIKVEDLLPPEIEMDGFDNIAAALSVSPSFLDQYVGAARFIAKRAVGSSQAKFSKTLHQPTAVAGTDGLPLGSNGGFRFTHFFPADGEYRLSILDDLTGGLYTNPSLHRRTIMMFVDGKPIFRGDIGGKDDLGLADKQAATGRAKVMERFANIPIKVTSGAHEVVVASVERARALSDENVGGSGGGFFGAGNVNGGGALRIVAGVEIAGPFGATTIGSSPSRDKIMICIPQLDAEQLPCAQRIARNLAEKAYRRPVNDADVSRLMGFFESGRKEIGDFDGGVQEIVMAVLSSPDFLYRIIQPKGDDTRPQPLSALELASRLSFFLWSDLPDDELLQLAMSGKLPEPAVYKQQVRRMLDDRRAVALVNGFAMRWLNVDDLNAVDPDARLFPRFNEALRQDFSTEIRLFLGDVLLGNRSVIELLSADYTFVNERLAGHYGMNGVLGSQFRRVQLSDASRRGLLGKGAVLLRTSYGDRTSPVLRGAWVLEKLLGTPATPPPPGVETNLNAKEGATPTTLRERLELHRQAKSCNQCHGVIDPIGLAMENFDVTGAFRTRDTGLPVDASTVLPNGVAINGVTELRNSLLTRPGQFVQAMTEKLLMYSIGREVEPSDMPQVRQIVRDAAQNNYRFFDIVNGIVHSDAFRLQGPPHEAPGAKPQPTVASAR
jgi:Protein of unknown function (DUF1592)/Protein of unknown function (DUF1588)/Protein of unknown function (DUF1585)/Protein of unknown function (DUF1587)/Protein of unknown function (DUF1595)